MEETLFSDSATTDVCETTEVVAAGVEAAVAADRHWGYSEQKFYIVRLF